MSALKRWRRVRSRGETRGCCLHELNWLNNRQEKKKNMFIRFCCYQLQLCASSRWHDLLTWQQHISCVFVDVPLLSFFFFFVSFYFLYSQNSLQSCKGQKLNKRLGQFIQKLTVSLLYLSSHADPVWHKGFHQCKFMEKYWFVINPACVASAEPCSCSWISSVFPGACKIFPCPVFWRLWNLSKLAFQHWRLTKHF